MLVFTNGKEECTRRKSAMVREAAQTEGAELKAVGTQAGSTSVVTNQD